LNATVAQFRTGWFIESIVSAALIVLVVRSRRPFFRSRPSKLLALATAVIVIIAALTPYLPFAGALGFQPMPARFYPAIAAIVVTYIAAAELAKLLFYRTNRRSLSAKTQQAQTV
jgi:P-type Mg2+ transporter